MGIMDNTNSEWMLIKNSDFEVTTESDVEIETETVVKAVVDSLVASVADEPTKAATIFNSKTTTGLKPTFYYTMLIYICLVTIIPAAMKRVGFTDVSKQRFTDVSSYFNRRPIKKRTRTSRPFNKQPQKKLLQSRVVHGSSRTRTTMAKQDSHYNSPFLFSHSQQKQTCKFPLICPPLLKCLDSLDEPKNGSRSNLVPSQTNLETSKYNVTLQCDFCIKGTSKTHQLDQVKNTKALASIGSRAIALSIISKKSKNKSASTRQPQLSHSFKQMASIILASKKKFNLDRVLSVKQQQQHTDINIYPTSLFDLYIAPIVETSTAMAISNSERGLVKLSNDVNEIGVCYRNVSMVSYYNF